MVVPPFEKPRTPLADLYSFLNHKEIPIDFTFSFRKSNNPDATWLRKRLVWEGLRDKILKEQYDIGVIASFGHMIPSYIINAFKLKTMLVVHPSLLPKYRGACPIQHAILSGDRETGVSIIEISKNEFDAGKVLTQDKVQVEDLVTTYKDLQEILPRMGG